MKLQELITKRKELFASVGILLVLLSVGLYYQFRPIKSASVRQTNQEVKTPTIVNGELVLPKVITTNFGGKNKATLVALTANLVAIFDQTNPMAPKLIGIRILGETQSYTDLIVDQISPVIKFYDAEEKIIVTKIGHLSTGFNFFGVPARGKTIFDVTVDNPPQAEKLEIILNEVSSTTSAQFEPLKIASQSMEIKTVTYDAQTGATISTATKSAIASSSAETASESATTSNIKTAQYYYLTGTLINPFSESVSDVTIYAWVRDKDGRVFGFSKIEFNNDLLSPAQPIDFKTNILPIRDNQQYASYEVAVWGKRYRFGI